MGSSASFEGRLLEGFGPPHDVESLRRSCQSLPLGGGVYVVLLREATCPGLLETSTGGRFKGRDPTVSIDVLKRNWLEGTRVVYVGKGNCLRSRIQQLIDFAHGKPVGHWGGRLLWQLADRDRLMVTCRETAGESPESVESRMLAEFVSAHGRLPFANLVS